MYSSTNNFNLRLSYFVQKGKKAILEAHIQKLSQQYALVNTNVNFIRFINIFIASSISHIKLKTKIKRRGNFTINKVMLPFKSINERRAFIILSKRFKQTNKSSSGFFNRFGIEIRSFISPDSIKKNAMATVAIESVINKNERHKQAFESIPNWVYVDWKKNKAFVARWIKPIIKPVKVKYNNKKSQFIWRKMKGRKMKGRK